MIHSSRICATFRALFQHAGNRSASRAKLTTCNQLRLCTPYAHDLPSPLRRFSEYIHRLGLPLLRE